jgi:hypothetical protein
MTKFDPSVDKKLLLVLAGVIWFAVGIMLCNLASGWLTQTSSEKALWPGLAGLVLSLFIFQIGFIKIVRKNAERILAYKNRICIFAFQPWKSYFIVIIMITMGMALRNSPLPKTYLAIVYIGFGLAMILSALKYFWIFLKAAGNR